MADLIITFIFLAVVVGGVIITAAVKDHLDE